MFAELQLPLLEHGVVDRVLGLEVGVERGSAHPDLACDLTQGEPGDTGLFGESPCCFEDLASGLVVATLSGGEVDAVWLMMLV